MSEVKNFKKNPNEWLLPEVAKVYELDPTPKGKVVLFKGQKVDLSKMSLVLADRYHRKGAKFLIKKTTPTAAKVETKKAK